MMFSLIIPFNGVNKGLENYFHVYQNKYNLVFILVGIGSIITEPCRGYQGTLHSDACKSMRERYMHFFLLPYNIRICNLCLIVSFFKETILRNRQQDQAGYYVECMGRESYVSNSLNPAAQLYFQLKVSNHICYNT